MKHATLALSALLLTSLRSAFAADVPAKSAVDLIQTLSPLAVKSLAEGRVKIVGSVLPAIASAVRVRVTTSFGTTHIAVAKAEGGHFECHYPQDFPGASALKPSLLYVDATDLPDFGSADAPQHQAEITLIVSGGKEALPDLPLVFTDDFVDAQGRKDQQAAQWGRQRTLANLFMHSRAARLMRLHKPGFDLDRVEDFAWFKQRATLYDFDHRDRDWSQSLGHRVARGFWQAVWNAWFNQG